MGLREVKVGDKLPLMPYISIDDDPLMEEILSPGSFFTITSLYLEHSTLYVTVLETTMHLPLEWFDPKNLYRCHS